MSKPDIDLMHIGEVLNKHGVDYVVVGGMAVVLQGGEASTVDVDLAFDRSAENIERLADALQELAAGPKRWARQNYRLRSSDLGSKWLHLESDSGDIDLIADVPGLSYDSIKQSSDRFDIDGTRIPVASVNDLIEMKRDTGRGKDAIHVSELQDLVKLRAEPHESE